MLHMNDISKTFFAGTVNERRALVGVDLKLQEGDFVTVIGSNGAGKVHAVERTLGSLRRGLWPD